MGKEKLLCLGVEGEGVKRCWERRSKNVFEVERKVFEEEGVEERGRVEVYSNRR